MEANKILIHNEEQVKAIIMAWGYDKFSHFLQIKDFEKFPAILCYFIDENDYSLSHSAAVYHNIVYLDDFEV